jgi:hypothetical protein
MIGENSAMSIVVDIVFILLGIALAPVLATLFLLRWGQMFPGFGRWAERKFARVSPRLGHWVERLLSEKEQRG